MPVFIKRYQPISNKILSEYNSFRSKNQIYHLCHAPFKSLRFSQSGNILACCYNRGFMLGKYPQQSIHEAWFGSNIAKLRKNIVHNDLSQGCSECSRRIENRLFNLSGAYQYDYLAEQRSGKYPVMFDFEISNICNLECVMCTGENSSSIRSKREKLHPYEQHYDANFVEQLKEFIPHLKEARFSGGEPFLIPIYYDIWELLIEKNPEIKISVLTNGTILNDRIKKMLSKGNFHISVSMDSLQKETYEKIRKNASFDESIRNLEFFYTHSRSKNNDFNLNVCPMLKNWKEIPSIIRYCNERDIILILHTVSFPPVESLWASDSGYLEEILSYLETKKIDSDSPTGQKNKNTYYQFVNQIKNWKLEASIFEKKKKTLIENTENELLDLLKQHIIHPQDLFSSGITAILYKYELTEKERKTIIINLLRFPPDLIINEFIHNVPEKLLQRLIMFK